MFSHFAHFLNLAYFALLRFALLAWLCFTRYALLCVALRCLLCEIRSNYFVFRVFNVSINLLRFARLELS